MNARNNFEHGFAVTDTSAKPPRFVLGIGASAGGLESLEKLFRNLPTDRHRPGVPKNATATVELSAACPGDGPIQYAIVLVALAELLRNICIDDVDWDVRSDRCWSHSELAAQPWQQLNESWNFVFR